MDQEKIETFKRVLEQRREKALKTLDRIESHGFNDTQAEYVSELSVYDNQADIGSETYEMEKNMA